MSLVNTATASAGFSISNSAPAMRAMLTGAFLLFG